MPISFFVVNVSFFFFIQFGSFYGFVKFGVLTTTIIIVSYNAHDRLQYAVSVAPIENILYLSYFIILYPLSGASTFDRISVFVRFQTPNIFVVQTNRYLSLYLTRCRRSRIIIIIRVARGWFMF